MDYFIFARVYPTYEMAEHDYALCREKTKGKVRLVCSVEECVEHPVFFLLALSHETDAIRIMQETALNGTKAILPTNNFDRLCKEYRERFVAFPYTLFIPEYVSEFIMDAWEEAHIPDSAA